MWHSEYIGHIEELKGHSALLMYDRDQGRTYVRAQFDDVDSLPRYYTHNWVTFFSYEFKYSPDAMKETSK